MNYSQTESSGSSNSRKRKHMQPALVRQQVSEKRSNDLYIHRINKDLVKIGRGFHSDVKVLNINVSRTHSILQQNNGSGMWSLTNVSKFETYVNGKALQQYENRLLRFGDSIKFSKGDNCTYDFCLIEEKEDDTSNAPKMLCQDDDASRLINNERSLLYLHQQHEQELEIESAELQDEYHAYMTKSTKPLTFGL